MCSSPSVASHPTDAFASRRNSRTRSPTTWPSRPGQPTWRHYAGRYVSDECDGHIELRAEGAHLAADLLGKVRRLQAGAEGELVTDESIVLRVPPLAEAGTFVFASWGLRGLQYRRANR